MDGICLKNSLKSEASNLGLDHKEEYGMFLYNMKEVDFPRERTVYQWFEEQVEKTPDQIALVFENKKLTYRELNTRANKLAHGLREKGIKANHIVGLMVSRSLEMMIGILGILKAGGAYLPIDTEYPAKRVRYMLEDSGTKVLLTQKQFYDKCTIPYVEIIDIEDEGVYKGDGINPSPINSSSHLAYVMYTSGSTGNPKGVMIQHMSISNFIAGMRDVIDYSNGKTAVAVTTVSFDVSINDAIIPIVSGLKLIMASEDQQKNPDHLSRLIVENNVQMMVTTPSRVKLLVDSKSSKECFGCLTEIMIGGEAFPNQLLEKINKLTSAKVYNMYGPTETTVWSTYKELKPDGEINIGRPLANNRIYILDENKNLLKTGEVGELFIGGEGLARGYINKPDQTSERFMEDVFFPGKRMYRTGDLARYCYDGDIEFLGRVDNQVKIRGYRIELGEIESHLLKHGSISEAVVLARVDTRADGDENNYICAYIIGDRELKIRDLKNSLLKVLPEYMIPSYFIWLEQMPLNTNGKIDTKALPDPVKELNTRSSFDPPKNDIEKKLQKIWIDILGIEKISINDSFFDLGGQSLKATMLISKIYKSFDVDLSHLVLFNNETIKKLGEYISLANKNTYLSIEPSDKMDHYPLSSAQKRLFILDRLEDTKTGYNLQSILLFEGNISKKRIVGAIKALIQRHEVLRTSFEFLVNEPVQIIHNYVNIDLVYLEALEDNLKKVLEDFIEPFDITKAPLMRVALVRVSKNKHILIFDMHHIICDGISTTILMREFADLYNGKVLDELTIRYGDFAIWQNNLLKSDMIKKQRDYWMGVFSGRIPEGELCTDFPRPKKRHMEGEKIEFYICKELVNQLREIGKNNNSTMYMVLLAIYNILLAKFNGQDDIVVGSGTSGRVHPDLENLVGMFVNTLMMRNQPNGNKTFKDFLREVRENTLMAYDNQSYPYDKLIEDLAIDRQPGRRPLHDAVFLLQNMEEPQISIEGLKVTSIEPDIKIAEADLALFGSEKNGGIAMHFIYCIKLFMKETILNLSKQYVRIAEQVSEKEDILIKDIQIIDDSEKEKLLYTINNKNKEISFEFD